MPNTMLRGGTPGPKGDFGDKGEKGLSGERGLPGTKGERGDAGLAGISGERVSNDSLTKVPALRYMYMKISCTQGAILYRLK